MGIGEHLASDNFTVGGFPRAIYFYAGGKNHEDIAAYVCLHCAGKQGNGADSLGSEHDQF